MTMSMWNWLLDCYKERSITLDDLERVMQDDRSAGILWEDWAADSGDFIEYVRDGVYPFIEYLKKKERK